MTLDHLIEAIVYGSVEGLTEFLPVSSTGHLLLLGHFLGTEQEIGQSWKTFVVLIQLGAILAIMTVYFRRLMSLATNLTSDPGTQRFVAGIFIAFLPAVGAGLVLNDIVKNVFYESPTIVCVSLVVGGFVLFLVDALTRQPKFTEAERYPLLTYLLIGIAQCVAMIPGVSRSGATIASAVLLGSSKRAAAEFSFFLAMPTMAAAFVHDVYKYYKDAATTAEKCAALLAANDPSYQALCVQNVKLSPPDMIVMTSVGFVAAFVAGVIVVKLFLEIVSRYGFAPFAWYRIIAGVLGLVAIYTLPAPHPTAQLDRPAIIAGR